MLKEDIDKETVTEAQPHEERSPLEGQQPFVGDSAPQEEDEQEEMYDHFTITIDKGQAIMRVDKFLANRLENRSRNRIQIAARNGNIVANGVAVKANYKIKPLDEISIVLPYPPRESETAPENIPIKVEYEDEELLIINKEPGMVVHPGFGNFSGTLINALTYYLQELPLFQSGDVRAGLVHRLDKDTSGLMVVAKSEEAHVKLAKQFFDKTVYRRYNAIVWGGFEQDEGTIVGNIGRDPKDRMKMRVFEDGSDGKHAVTHYKVLKRYGYVTLVECRLETGRTHQIRVHMSWLGHPIFNDSRYGGDEILKGTRFTKYKQFIENCFKIMPRQALHAKSLGFDHPKTGEYVGFDSELPKDIAAVIEKWESYTAGNPREIE